MRPPAQPEGIDDPADGIRAGPPWHRRRRARGQPGVLPGGSAVPRLRGRIGRQRGGRLEDDELIGQRVVAVRAGQQDDLEALLGSHVAEHLQGTLGTLGIERHERVIEDDGGPAVHRHEAHEPESGRQVELVGRALRETRDVQVGARLRGSHPEAEALLIDPDLPVAATGDALDGRAHVLLEVARRGLEGGLLGHLDGLPGGLVDAHAAFVLAPLAPGRRPAVPRARRPAQRRRDWRPRAPAPGPPPNGRRPVPAASVPRPARRPEWPRAGPRPGQPIESRAWPARSAVLAAWSRSRARRTGSRSSTPSPRSSPSMLRQALGVLLHAGQQRRGGGDIRHAQLLQRPAAARGDGAGSVPPGRCAAPGDARRSGAPALRREPPAGDGRPAGTPAPGWPG